STVEVVVPSPALSLVLLAASLTSWAPMFSAGSASSISSATVTPSLVTLGPPQLLSSTAFRPRGPSVLFTAAASFSTPSSRLLRASTSKVSSFPGRLIPLQGGARASGRTAPSAGRGQEGSVATRTPAKQRNSGSRRLATSPS